MLCARNSTPSLPTRVTRLSAEVAVSRVGRHSSVILAVIYFHPLKQPTVEATKRLTYRGFAFQLGNLESVYIPGMSVSERARSLYAKHSLKVDLHDSDLIIRYNHSFVFSFLMTSHAVRFSNNKKIRENEKSKKKK